jgi:hypothetical protein
VYLVRDGSGTEFTLENDSYIVRNIVTDFGAVADGVTNNSTAFADFRTWAQQQTQPVKLIVPAGSYVQGTTWTQGIKTLLVEGPATFADNRRVGTNAWQRQTAMHSLRLEAVAHGASTITVKDVDPGRLPASLGDPSGNPVRSLATLMDLVAPGQWVIISALDLMGFGYPTNPQLFEYNRVASVNADTVTLEWPTKNAYGDGYPVYWNGATLQQATNITNLSGTFSGGQEVITSNGHTLVVHSYPSTFNGATNGVRFTLESLVGKTVPTGATLTGPTGSATVVQTGPNGLGGYRNFEADQAGPATLYLLDPAWDTEVTLRDLSWPTSASGQVSFAGRKLRLERVDFSGMTAVPNSLWPSGARTLEFVDCTMNAPEHDKLVEELIIRGGSATTHIVQSASIGRMVIEDHSCNGIGGTVRNSEIRNVTVANAVAIGPSGYGSTESVLIEGSSAAALTWHSGRNVLLSGVSFSDGIFSKSDPNPQGVATFGQGWAVPGSAIVLSNSAKQALAIARVLGMWEDAGTAYVETDLDEVPNGADRIIPHPCLDVTATGNTGALAVLNGQSGTPLFSHASLTGPGTATLWGGLTELRVDVTGTFDGELTISGPAEGGAWSAKINLNHAGERVITASGATGARPGDTLPAADWFRGAFTISAGGGSFTIAAQTEQFPERAGGVTSSAIGYYPMDEASGNFVNALYPSTYLRRDDSGYPVTQQTEPSGLVLARTGHNSGTPISGMTGNSADGFFLPGARPWCVHGFIRWRNNFNTKATMRSGGNPGPWFGGPRLQWVHNTGPRLTCYDGTGAEVVATGSATAGTLYYAAFGWDGANVFLKLSSNGEAWATVTAAMAVQQMEIQPHVTTFSLGGAEVDLGQICVTRDIPSEEDLTWFANGMAGHSTAGVLERLGAWPEPQRLPATVQVGGGTTWSGTTLLSHTGFIRDSDTPVGDLYWCKPYYLRGMDTALADANGDYVWLLSSDHSGGGIALGFSESPATPPAAWQRIWAAGVAGEPGATNADIAGFHASSETPWLVYNPDDPNGRPFWLYYHDLGRSIAQGDGSTGYNAPQETRLITSATLLRGSWQYEQTVLPVRNHNPNQVLNHRGYAVVLRNGPGDWEAWHLGSDRWDHTFARSTSTDGKSWTLDWFQADTYYRRWEGQQWCPPGWRLGAMQDVFTYGGRRYALGHMDVAPRDGSNGGANSWPSFRDADERAVYVAPLGSDGLVSGPPTIVYTSTGPYYDAANTSHNDPARIAPHDGYIQSTKCFMEGSTLHLYIKHRFKPPCHIVYATVDLSPLM